ncbi:thymidine kinase [Fusobacterium sp. MFO224]|uniref:thymidine kinase n=1 Tax=Fusobacterium sp. MFO224 TaxID=3378070 RepID=UPI003853D0AB
MLNIICGGMYSGKSTELLRRYERNKYARRKALLFNHSLDTRYGESIVSTHLQDQKKAYSISKINEMLDVLNDNKEIKNIYIDEFQFFSEEFSDKIISLVEKEGYDITVAGLDLAFDNKSFRSMEKLMPYADDILKLKAVCSECGKNANKSYRLNSSKEKVEVGADNVYVALCRECYNKIHKN